MPRNVLETVFVAWGGNQTLARLIGRKLEENHYGAIVGGGQQTDMFVGTQVLSQIHKCTRAILLVQDVGATQTPSGYNFSDNLMFEWGYITGVFQPTKVHVFLIDVEARDLPSDLAGSWASEVTCDGRKLDAIATQIVDTFVQDASHHVELDKFEIMHMWNQVLHYIETYDETPLCSDIELAHYLLHSIETCYYYMDEDRLEELLLAMHPVSSVLEHAVLIAKANIRLFRETGGLQRPLAFDSFMELKTFFDRPYDVAYQDDELNCWFTYFTVRRQSLLYRMVALNDDFEEDERTGLLKTTLQALNKSADALDVISSRYPADTAYVNLYRGHVERDRFTVCKALGMDDAAATHNEAALKAKEAFYIDYKTKYPQDLTLIQHLAEEYYLALAEHLAYVEDPIAQRMAKATISGFISKLERDSGRQHVVLSELRASFA